MITVVDYQMGNLRSVQKAFERVGHAALVSGDPQQVAEASKLVLPGVGAFGDAMRELATRGLVEPIRQFVERGRPLLGVCLGLQLLMDVSYEGGRHEGLGLVAGEVRRFELPRPYKIPHMGWNQVRVRQGAAVLSGLDSGAWFYFVHSYYVVPRDPQWTALESDYGHPFCAMIARDNLFATQFHPEKSQARGLELLRSFAEL